MVGMHKILNIIITIKIIVVIMITIIIIVLQKHLYSIKMIKLF